MTYEPDVYLAESCYGGLNYYVVMVDGKPYDAMSSAKPLTLSQMIDVAAGYKEALTEA